MAYRRNRNKIEELSDDTKNDLLLAFDLFKNSRSIFLILDKLTKSKLRTILFSFAMYKSAPGDINEFINENYKQDEFTYEELCNLVTLKSSSSKDRDIEDTWLLINRNNHSNKQELSRAFSHVGIETNDKELNEMIEMIKESGDKDFFTKEEFKNFVS